MRAVHFVGIAGLLALGSCGRAGFKEELPNLDTSTDLLRFDAGVGDVATPATLSIVDVGGLIVPWRAIVSHPWVHLSPREGLTPAEVQVSVSTTGLRPGTHRAGVAIVMEGGGQNASGASFVVEVTLAAPGWTPLDGPYCAFGQSAAVNPDDPNIVMVGDDNGDMLVSTDGGQSFVMHDENAPAAFRDIVMLPGGRGYAGSTGLFRTDDGGLSWSLAGLNNISLTSVAVHPGDEDVILAEGNGLWRSVDGGLNWESVSAPTSTYFVTADPTRPGTFFVGSTMGTVLVTSGAPGAPATPAAGSTGVSTEHIVSGVVLPSGRWVVVHDSNQLVYGSDDAGASWQRLGGAGFTPSDQSVDMWFEVLGNDIYALHKSLYRSTDGGDTFTLIASPARQYRGNGRRYYAIADHPDGPVVAHQSFGALRLLSDDTLVQLPLFECEIRGLQIDATSGNVYGVMTNGGVFGYIGRGFTGLSGNGGPSAVRYYDMSLDPRSAFSMALSTEDDRIRVTIDGGTSWSNGVGQTHEDARCIGRAPDDPDVLWACTGDGLFRSADNGTSWTKLLGGSLSELAPISANEAVVLYQGEVQRVNAMGTLTSIFDPSDSWTHASRSADGSLWLGLGQGLYRSTDAGMTFTDLGLDSTTFYAVEVMPNPNHIFVATSAGLFESVDAGSSWVDVNSPFRASGLIYDAGAGLLYVGTGRGGLYTYDPF